MYKRQFAKWKWTKYNIQSSCGTPPTGQAFRSASDKSCKRLRASKRSPSPRTDGGADARCMSPNNSSAISRRPATNLPTLSRYSPRPDDLTSLRCGSLLSVREYLKVAHGGGSEPGGGAKIKEFSIGCDSWHLVCLMDLALNKLRGDECHVGGRLLRHIFRDIGKSLDGMCLQTFFGLCIQMPDYILRHGRLDILRIYLAYLADLGSLRLPQHHPLTSIVGMLKDLSHAFPASLPLCLSTLSRVWVDDLSQLRGPIDIHVLSSRYLVQVAKEGPDESNISGGDAGSLIGGNGSGNPGGATAALQLISDFGLLLREATTVHDPTDPTCIFLEDQILHLQWRFDAYEDDFVPRSRRAIENLLRKYETLDGSGSGVGQTGAALPFTLWAPQDLLMYQRCHLRLLEFLYRTGRLEEAHLAATRSIEATDDRMRLRWSGYLEQLLRWMDRHADADEVGRRWGQLPLLGELEREDRVELSGISTVLDEAGQR